MATWRAARKQMPRLTEAEVREALFSFDPLWDELFPAEQARIVRLLVERVDVGMDEMQVRLCTDGLADLLGELGSEGGGMSIGTETTHDEGVLVVRIPLKRRTRGGRRLMVAPGAFAKASDGRSSSHQTLSDDPILKALGRAWRWKRLLETGIYFDRRSRRKERIHKSYVCPPSAPDAAVPCVYGSDPRRAAFQGCAIGRPDQFLGGRLDGAAGW